MSDELIGLSATKLASLIRGREVSPVEVLEAHLRLIERLNPNLNAIVTLATDACERAREAEALIMRNGSLGPLHGVPITIKDTIETKGLRTTAGSKLLAEHFPATDAPAVALLKASGAIILGKSNVPEMAIPYECDNPLFGRTNNPFDQTRTSGGSSGGEAAAISAGLSTLGLGSDLSGSIRVPAHFCGIFGLKPTTGLVSSAGHVPKAESALSFGAVLGPMARHVEDLSLLLEVLTEERTSEGVRIDLTGSRVGVFVDEEYAPISNETRQALESVVAGLNDAGLIVVEEQPPCIRPAIALWPQLFSRAAAVQLKDFYQGREDEAGKVVRSILASGEGENSPSPEVDAAALAERQALREELSSWMETTPLILMPVGAVPAFKHGARHVDVNGQSISVFRAFGYSRAANVLGFPAVAVPVCKSEEGLPIGIQIIGRPNEEETILAAASIIEETLRRKGEG